MAATGHGATFTFTSNRGTIRGGVTKLSVDAPTAEVVDATGLYDGGDVAVMVPTGAWRGGVITIEFVAGKDIPGVQTVVRGVGQLTFASTGINVSRRVILESGSEYVSVGDVVRGTLRFVMTDWTGN
jgi:hypothetical protein